MNQHTIKTVWLTGLPCSGKTTIGKRVIELLTTAGVKAELLDGDELRKKWPDLGYSELDRRRNILRVTALCTDLIERGIIPVVAVVSPFRAHREEAYYILGSIGGVLEIHVQAPLEVCEMRDVKGMYAQARAGKIAGFTGVDAPYESPLHPDVTCYTLIETIAKSAAKVMAAIICNMSVGEAANESKAAQASPSSSSVQ